MLLTTEREECRWCFGNARTVARLGGSRTGGAVRHCAAAILKPIPFLRIMGRKTEMEVVTVMMKLCYCQLRPSTARCIPLSQLLQKGGRAVNTYNDIKANIQILGSRAGVRNRLSVKGSGMASSRSLLIRRTMKSRSFVLRKRHERSDFSGKSTRVK